MSDPTSKNWGERSPRWPRRSENSSDDSETPMNTNEPGETGTMRASIPMQDLPDGTVIRGPIIAEGLIPVYGPNGTEVGRGTLREDGLLEIKIDTADKQDLVKDLMGHNLVGMSFTYVGSRNHIETELEEIEKEKKDGTTR